MIRPLHSSAISCVAAVAFRMCVAPTPMESEAPPDDTRQFDSQEREKVSVPDFGPQTARATASGGWPRIAKPLGPDARGKPVLELRRRLAAEDFLAREDANEPVWDAKLEDAVKRFQSHMGLEQTGTVSRPCPFVNQIRAYSAIAC